MEAVEEILQHQILFGFLVGSLITIMYVGGWILWEPFRGNLRFTIAWFLSPVSAPLLVATLLFSKPDYRNPRRPI